MASIILLLVGSFPPAVNILVGDEQDPDIYVIRGQQYLFRNQMGAHPFEIRTTAGVALTTGDGITGDNPVSNGEQYWNVYMNADDDRLYINLREAYREGIPDKEFSEEQIQGSTKLYSILSNIGGKELIGNAKSLSPGTFRSNSKRI